MSQKTSFHASIFTQAQLKSIRAALADCSKAGVKRERSIKFGEKCDRVLNYFAQQQAGTATGELATGMSTWALDKVVRAFDYSGVKMPKALGEKLAAALDSAVAYAK